MPRRRALPGTVARDAHRQKKRTPATGLCEWRARHERRSRMSQEIVPHEALRRALLWALAAAMLLAVAYVEGTVPVMYR